MIDDRNKYELSTVRMIAESILGNLDDPGYFDKICSEFLNIFDASLCALFWFRNREPAGWWLEAWSSKDEKYSPGSDFIPREKEGLLEWMRINEKCVYHENIHSEPITQFWGIEALTKSTVTLIPLNISSIKFGVLVILDPNIYLPRSRILKHIEALGDLIQSACRNNMLYKNLHITKEEFYDLFENSSDMVAVVYPDGIIRDCNLAFRETLGLQVDPQGLNLHDFIRKVKDITFYECWENLLDGQKIKNVDVILETRDGVIIETELSGNVSLHPDSRIAFVRLYLRDVTEKRMDERHKHELELKMKLMRQRELVQIGLYVSGVAHNLKNPIHAIQGYLELMGMKGVDCQEMVVIQKNTENINEIIDNLLDKVHHERNTENRSINLNKLLERELKFLTANMYYKNDVKKDFRFAENLPDLQGVYGDYSQAIMNIIYNALDAMTECGERLLKIQTKYLRESNLIRLTISDTGIGIPDEIREQIFEPFFTTKERNRKDDHGLASGSGLGLSSTKSLLEPYNGTIEIDSTVGKGTTFYITFKCA